MPIWLVYALFAVVGVGLGILYTRTGIREARRANPYHPWIPIASGMLSFIAAAVSGVLMVIALIFGG